MTTTPLLLLLAAAGANGLLTEASLDQSIKQLPARHRIGPAAFVAYSQAADLANGFAWYVVLGVGTALLTLITAGAGLAGQPPTAAAVALWVAIGFLAPMRGSARRSSPARCWRQARWTLGITTSALAAMITGVRGRGEGGG